MNSTFIQSMQELKEYCERVKEQLMCNKGDCKTCSLIKRCNDDLKERNIDSIGNMTEIESKFPLLLKMIKNNKALLYSVPAKVYRNAYGSYNDNLPCPFCGFEIINNIDKIEMAYNMLTDMMSKYTLLNVLMYRLTLNREYVKRSYSMLPQYFIDGFRNLGENQVYVDCGAYIGDSFAEYLKYNHMPRATYLFEPDKTNCRILEEKTNPYKQSSDISIINKGLYSQSGTLYIVEGKGTSSYVSETPVLNSKSVEVCAIDDVIQEPVSFIKMDIEGFEKKALNGAKQHILDSYPKLAISVYHSVNDLWEIPIMIKEKYKGYTHFAIRHHSCFFNETVFYAYSELV